MRAPGWYRRALRRCASNAAPWPWTRRRVTISLAADVATIRAVLDGPAVLVGHSYGGAVVTEAGLHEAVTKLVYITAFAPDKDESVDSLISGFPQDGPQPPILPPRDSVPP